MASVEIEWHWIDFEPSDTRSMVRAKLKTAGAKECLFDRAVYVIRLKPPFCIKYPSKHSPTLYIGEGDILSRLDAHRVWLDSITSLGFAFALEVACCFPRVRKNERAYKNFEAHLLEVFYSRYGTLPLKNSIHETKNYFHEYNRVATSDVIGPRSGTRHTWAIEPLPSNPFQQVFARTHAER